MPTLIRENPAGGTVYTDGADTLVLIFRARNGELGLLHISTSNVSVDKIREIDADTVLWPLVEFTGQVIIRS